jgi:hypothetical protein
LPGCHSSFSRYFLAGNAFRQLTLYFKVASMKRAHRHFLRPVWLAALTAMVLMVIVSSSACRPATLPYTTGFFCIDTLKYKVIMLWPFPTAGNLYFL